MIYNLLHLSRASQALVELGVELSPLSADLTTSLVAMSAISEEQANILIGRIFPGETDIKVEQVGEFFLDVSAEMKRYNDEIERRRQHAVRLGVYVEDSEDVLKTKAEKVKDAYMGDPYLQMVLMLSKAGIHYADLTISEAMLAVEVLTCEEINSGSSQLAAMLESDTPTMAKTLKDMLRYANFVAFALDIYEELDKLWLQMSKKDKTTNYG